MSLIQIYVLVVICVLANAHDLYRPKSVDGELCKIPFEHNRETFHQCTKDGDTKNWCKLPDGQKVYCAPGPSVEGCDIKTPNTTVAEVELILKLINEARAKEPALRMSKIRWNTELAERAQFMSDKCDWRKGDLSLCFTSAQVTQMSWVMKSKVPPLSAWEKMIDRYLSEKRNYNYETNVCTGPHCVGYKILVNAKTTDVGCAMTTCFQEEEYNSYYYCNFYPPNYGTRPYEKGSGHCNNCHDLDSDKLYRCSDNLCEICDKPAADCRDKSQAKDEIKHGWVQKIGIVQPVVAPDRETMQFGPMIEDASGKLVPEDIKKMRTHRLPSRRGH